MLSGTFSRSTIPEGHAGRHLANTEVAAPENASVPNASQVG
jgi:hypothetical protein